MAAQRSVLDLGGVVAFRPDLRVERVAADTMFLIGERERFLISGLPAVTAAVLVDGRRTVLDILRAARDRISEPEALYALQCLADAGHLGTGSGETDDAAFWSGMGLDAQARRVLRDAAVSVIALGDIAHAAALTEALIETGIAIDSAGMQIVVTDDYLRPELAAINRRALDTHTAWFLVKPGGVQPWIGPLFEPAVTACWDCAAFWIRHNRPVEEFARRSRAGRGEPGEPRIAAAACDASVRTACGLAALAIARVVAGAARRDAGSQLVAIDLAGCQIAGHAVTRRPQCPTCGDPGLMAASGERRIAPQPVGKAHCEDGGYRAHSPRRTYERYRHLVSPITGAVTHLVATPDRDTELRAVYASGYLVCPREAVLRSNLFDRACAGKGRSAEQARVSALCEAVERFSGVYQGDEARLRASQRELGSAALPLDTLLNFSEAQYRDRDRHNARVPDLHRRIPEPLDPDTPIDWTPGWSLIRQDRRHVPLVYCYAEAPADSGTRYCGPCSNGVAAGTCLEEAILQGVLELVERDAAATWWYNRIPRPAIDLDSFADRYFDALRADYQRLGWNIWVLDLTHDLGICACVALSHHAGTDRFALGFGCHLEPRLAVQRALTELNQLFDPAGTYRAPWDHDRLPEREYLFPGRELAPVAADQLPWIPGDDLGADIAICAARLTRAGVDDLVVVDKTRPDIGLHVAQVVAPGLRHFWPRFGPGRLYRVPCALGWLAVPRAERELNPVGLFV